MFQKVVFIGLILISNQLYAENYDFTPGLWETTTTQEIVELDAPPEIKKMMQHLSQRPADVEIECIESLTSLFESDDECQSTINHISANKIAVEMLCTEEDGISKGKGELNLKGKTFTSSLIMTSNNGPIKMTMKIEGNGKYIGACQ